MAKPVPQVVDPLNDRRTKASGYSGAILLSDQIHYYVDNRFCRLVDWIDLNDDAIWSGSEGKDLSNVPVHRWGDASGIRFGLPRCLGDFGSSGLAARP